MEPVFGGLNAGGGTSYRLTDGLLESLMDLSGIEFLVGDSVIGE